MIYCNWYIEYTNAVLRHNKCSRISHKSLNISFAVVLAFQLHSYILYKFYIYNYTIV